MKIGFRLLFICFVISALIPFASAQDARALKYTHHCEVVDDKLMETDSILFQVNNRNGESFTSVEIPYSKMIKVKNVKGWIEDKLGRKIRTLTGSDILDASQTDVGSLYQDMFVKTLHMKHYVYPYRVFYTYSTVQNQFLSLADWSPVVSPEIPTDTASLVIVAPATYPVKHIDRGVQSFRQESRGESVVYRWNAIFPKPFLPERSSARLSDLCPYVSAKPDKFSYGVEGDLSSWKSFGEWFRQLTVGLNDPSDIDRYEVQRLIKGTSDQKEIVKRIYHFMQDRTRYVNVTLGVGGFKPFPASYVSANKYGDCKALSNYMKALLEVAGIKSYFTIIEGSEHPSSIREDFPSQQFNHVILTVPLGRDTLYLENTSSVAPFGYVSTFIGGRKALLVDENASRLIALPGLKTGNSTSTRSITVNLGESADADAEMQMAFRGHNFDQLNGLKGYNNEEEQKHYIRQFIPAVNYDLKEWKLTHPDRDSAVMLIESKVTLQNYLSKVGNEYFLSIFRIVDFEFETPSDRELPVYLPFPISYRDTVRYVLPQGSKLKYLAKDDVVKSKYGLCSLRLSQSGDKVTMCRIFQLYPGRISLADYPDFYSFLKNVGEAELRCLFVFTKS